ncbi:Y45F3A.3b [Coccidioides immitis RMSCC 3703]|uniref:Y45F3A.3b n=1 Tax=Coccidioides immitis RMSCC 3703 TaxID=454286 RepID=A0A0J8R6U7_COCIT|nr:Y45F3A.3b [Coccidioides immitis RMSCC 3703]
MEPSSSTAGFFQGPPVIPPSIEDDGIFRRVVSLHLPSPIPQHLYQDLTQFSNLVLSKPIQSHIADAERNLPSVKPLTTFGVENKQDSLFTGEGWRTLQDIGIKEGIVASGYEKASGGDLWNNRVYQSLKFFLWVPSAAMVTCPSAMTDGAACLLGRHLDGENGEIFAEARRRLTSRDPSIAWTSGQWMTERKGGSDVRGTETVARKLSGAEKLETDGVDAHATQEQIGHQARTYSRIGTQRHEGIPCRKGRPGSQRDLYPPEYNQITKRYCGSHVRKLAQDHVKYAANTHLTFLVAALLGVSEGQESGRTPAAQANIVPQTPQQAHALLRLLTPMVKAQTALRAIKGVRACMENLGGVGYLENEDPLFNIARIFRDACVLSIWEGTTDIMADDVVRVVKGREGPQCLAVLGAWVSNALNVSNSKGFHNEGRQLQRVWEQWLTGVNNKDKEQLKWEGRNYLRDLEHVVCGCLLILDASRDQDDIAREIARRWILGDDASQGSWKAQAAWDKRIVFGAEPRNSRL